MRTDGVVVPPPALDDDPCFGEGVEDFSVEQLVAQPGVEALDEAILPRAARRDVGGFRADGGDPLLHSLGDEPGAVVGTNVLGNAAQDEQVREHVDDIGGFQPPVDANGDAFMRELINDVQHPVFPPVMGAILDEIIGPDVIASLRPQTDAGAVGEPQPTSFGLFAGNLQPLASPNALDPLVIDDPARLRPQQLRDLPIAVAAILASEFDDVGGQLLLVLSPPCHAALGRTMLPEHAPGARTVATWIERDRCRRGDARGLEVSLGGLGQDHLIQGQIGDGAAQPSVLRLELLHPFHLIRWQTLAQSEQARQRVVRKAQEKRDLRR